MRDEWFIRGDVPMTKSEVRAVSLSKLELCRDSVLYDVGAGTGSVSIEASGYLTEGRVYAVEKNAEAINLLKANKDKFNAESVEIIKGTAPEALKELEAPTHAFIGGASGSMEEVLNLLLKKNPEVRIVINIIALESLVQVLSWLKKYSIGAEIIQVQISKSRTAGDYHLMMGQNPVYVVSFGGKGGNAFEACISQTDDRCS